MRPSNSYIVVASVAWVTTAQIQLMNITQAAYPSITSGCFTILTQTVQCAPVLWHVQRAGGVGLPRFYSDTSLTALCNSTCATGLTTWNRRVVGACANLRVPTSSGKQRLVIQWAQEFLEAYNSACLVNKEGLRCNSVLAKAAGVNPSNQQSTATASQSWPCNTCFVSLISTQLAMPLAATDTGLLSTYMALTSKCSLTGWTTPTVTKTTWEISGTGATPAPTCVGTSVTVAGKTCQQISTTNRISTRSLLTANNLAGRCYQFPTTGSVCIPMVETCTPYSVKTGDTCTSIGKAINKTPIQIISWNPELDIDCGNIADYVGFVICTSNPGGSWVNPDPAPPMTTASFESIPTIAMTELAALPQPTRIGWNETVQHAPIADDSRLDCALYIQPPILTNWETGATSVACADVAAQYNVAKEDLLSWNPSLVSNCNLRTDRQYCVQYSRNDTTTSATQYCAEYSLAQPGWDCGKYAAVHGLEIAQLTQWNPALGAGCANFKTGVSYCVNVSGFRQPGIISTCNKFAVANETNWVRKPCEIVETTFGLSHARFVAWNPAVLTNCTGLYQGYAYCVSIPGYKPTYTTPAGATAT